MILQDPGFSEDASSQISQIKFSLNPVKLANKHFPGHPSPSVSVEHVIAGVRGHSSMVLGKSSAGINLFQ